MTLVSGEVGSPSECRGAGQPRPLGAWPLGSCALAIDRAALTDDVATYKAAIDQARSVLFAPLAWTDARPAKLPLMAEINGKVDLWQGLAGITAFVAPALKQYTGEKVEVVGETSKRDSATPSAMEARALFPCRLI